MEPSIKTGPTEVVIGMDSNGESLSQSAEFTCTAVGLPEPKIKWLYFTTSRGGELNKPMELSNNISVLSNTTEESGLIEIKYGIKLPIVQTDGGVIRCKTGSAYEDALLTVLGMHALCTYITTNNS